MKKIADRDRVRLEQALELIEVSIRLIPKQKKLFLADRDACDAAAMRVHAIGEDMRSLSNEFRELYPELPWHQAISMRNVIAHEYGHLDYHMIWETVTGDDFAGLRGLIVKILQKKS